MQVYHVWQKNGQQLTWVNGYDHLEEAEARADLYNHHRFSPALPIKYVVTGPHDETVEAMPDAQASDLWGVTAGKPPNNTATEQSGHFWEG